MEVKFRNRYLLVAVRSPDHHGLFVDDLAGGDGVDLLDVLDLGNGLHGVNNLYECDICGMCLRFQRAFSSFLPFSKGFLVFLFFRALYAENFASGCIKSTTWPALRPSFLSPDKKKRKLKKSKNGLGMCVPREFRLSCLKIGFRENELNRQKKREREREREKGRRW